MRRIETVGFFAALAAFFRDASASLAGKVLVALAAAYVIFPFDLVPDVVPVLGWIDDAGVATLAALYLSRALAPYRMVRVPIPVRVPSRRR